MIKNESLGDRLNEAKNKKEQPVEKILLGTNAIINIISRILSTLIVIAKIFAYGYSLKLVLHTNWDILGVVSIGLTINFLLIYLYDLIHSKSNNLTT